MKKMIFTVEQFMLDTNYSEDYIEQLEWPLVCDGKEVTFLDEDSELGDVGQIGPYMVHEDWCVEVENYGE